MAYDAQAWSDFAVAIVGAAAALAGLLFVAMSINIERIISTAGVPARAFGTLVLLAQPLLVGTEVLVPGQSSNGLGIELAVTGLAGLAAFLTLYRPSRRSRSVRLGIYLAGTYLPSVAVGALLVVAGISTAAGHGGGLYWVAPAVVLAFLGGLAGAWAVLVEILR